MKSNCGIIILAAGSSGRLGRPKQLLPYNDTSLLQHLMNEAGASDAVAVVVVLGATCHLIQPHLKAGSSHIVINKEWQEGMAASIRCGIKEITNINPNVDAAILMVCDQPYVSTALLNGLIRTHQETGKPIVTSFYDNAAGPPVLFHQSIFPELLLLSGDKGARKVVEAHTGNVIHIPFPDGKYDIDTAEDFATLS